MLYAKKDLHVGMNALLVSVMLPFADSNSPFKVYTKFFLLLSLPVNTLNKTKKRRASIQVMSTISSPLPMKKVTLSFWHKLWNFRHQTHRQGTPTFNVQLLRQLPGTATARFTDCIYRDELL